MSRRGAWRQLDAGGGHAPKCSAPLQGVTEGRQLVFARIGHEEEGFDTPGDVILIVSETPHALFQRGDERGPIACNLRSGARPLPPGGLLLAAPPARLCCLLGCGV